MQQLLRTMLVVTVLVALTAGCTTVSGRNCGGIAPPPPPCFRQRLQDSARKRTSPAL